MIEILNVLLLYLKDIKEDIKENCINVNIRYYYRDGIKAKWIKEMIDFQSHFTILGITRHYFFQIACSRGPPSLPSHLSPELSDFCLHCLELSPDQRPSAEDLLLHHPAMQI